MLEIQSVIQFPDQPSLVWVISKHPNHHIHKLHHAVLKKTNLGFSSQFMMLSVHNTPSNRHTLIKLQTELSQIQIKAEYYFSEWVNEKWMIAQQPHCSFSYWYISIHTEQFLRFWPKKCMRKLSKNTEIIKVNKHCIYNHLYKAWLYLVCNHLPYGFSTRVSQEGLRMLVTGGIRKKTDKYNFILT